MSITARRLEHGEKAYGVVNGDRVLGQGCFEGTSEQCPALTEAQATMLRSYMERTSPWSGVVYRLVELEEAAWVLSLKEDTHNGTEHGMVVSILLTLANSGSLSSELVAKLTEKDADTIK